MNITLEDANRILELIESSDYTVTDIYEQSFTAE